jgi:CIC family chloride channel protein
MADEPNSFEAARRPPPSAADAARTLAATIVVAVGAAAFAMAFRAGLQRMYATLLGAHDVLAAFVRLPVYARFLLPAAGGLAAGLVSRLTARSGSQGFGDVMEAVALGGARLSLKSTLWKALGSWLAIATGNSVGREGSLIQFGGSFGSTVANVFRLRATAARALIAAGTAAGFAAAYNTPLAAALFVVEIVTGVVAIEALAMVLIGTAISTTLVRLAVGGGPIYGERVFTIASSRELVAHAVLGLLAGLVGPLFMKMLAAGETRFQRSNISQPWRAGLGGAFVGLLASVLPEVAGNGYEPLNLLLDGQYAVPLVAVLVAAKALATTSSVSSGSPGGVFTPSLFIGGGLGLLWGHAVVRYAGVTGNEGGYALVGMAAMIAATTHAPLMASVLVFELSGDYAIVLPLVLATAVATVLSRRLERDSIYASELRRRGVEWEVTLGGKQVRTVRVPSESDASESPR